MPKVDAATRRKRRHAEAQRRYRERERQRAAVATVQGSPGDPVRSFLTEAMLWAAEQDGATARAVGLTAAGLLDALPAEDAQEDRLVRFAQLLDVPVTSIGDDAVAATATNIIEQTRAAMVAGTAAVADIRAGFTAAKSLATRRPRVDETAIAMEWARALDGPGGTLPPKASTPCRCTGEQHLGDPHTWGQHADWAELPWAEWWAERDDVYTETDE
jgi:hypothetical protein